MAIVTYTTTSKSLHVAIGLEGPMGTIDHFVAKTSPKYFEYCEAVLDWRAQKTTIRLFRNTLLFENFSRNAKHLDKVLSTPKSSLSHLPEAIRCHRVGRGTRLADKCELSCVCIRVLAQQNPTAYCTDSYQMHCRRPPRTLYN